MVSPSLENTLIFQHYPGENVEISEAIKIDEPD
jgi:hypothetical protein